MKIKVRYVWLCTIKRKPDSKVGHKIVLIAGKNRKKKSEVIQRLHSLGFKNVEAVKINIKDIREQYYNKKVERQEEKDV